MARAIMALDDRYEKKFLYLLFFATCSILRLDSKQSQTAFVSTGRNKMMIHE